MRSNRLCNATPLKVDWEYDRGVHIKIDPDGFIDLMDVAQANDFSGGQPGSETVREQMDFLGIFLRDPSVPYENQAHETLSRCLQTRQRIYNEFVERLRTNMSSSGNFSEEALNEKIKASGYARYAEDNERIRKRVEFFSSRTETVRTQHEQYDPEKTLMFHNPPRVFESKSALELYLLDHPDEADKHKRYMAALRGEEDDKQPSAE